MPKGIIDFIEESNLIEGIDYVSQKDVNAHGVFMKLPEIKPEDVQRFVSLVANADLREHAGMDVTVGSHRPYSGGPLVKSMFESLIGEIQSGIITSHEAHHRFETLHPFMDGNGRAGRVIWLWMEQRLWGKEDLQITYERGFLHSWYYQSLSNRRK